MAKKPKKKVPKNVHDAAVTLGTLQLAAKKGNRKQIKKQGHKTNHNVVQAWMNDKPFKSLRMSTDGKDLFSYNLEDRIELSHAHR